MHINSQVLGLLLISLHDIELNQCVIGSSEIRYCWSTLCPRKDPSGTGHNDMYLKSCTSEWTQNYHKFKISLGYSEALSQKCNAGVWHSNREHSMCRVTLGLSFL